MKDFLRVLRIAARQRLALAGCIFTSLVIAMLWGMNIGALYPVVEVVFKGDSLPSYVASRIEDNKLAVAAQALEIVRLQDAVRTATGDRQSKLQNQLRFANFAHEASVYRLSWLQHIEPTVKR